MIEKSKILDYLKKEIEILDLNCRNFSWMEDVSYRIMEKTDMLETIKAFIESGKFDRKEKIENDR